LELVFSLLQAIVEASIRSFNVLEYMNLQKSVLHDVTYSISVDTSHVIFELILIIVFLSHLNQYFKKWWIFVMNLPGLSK